MTQTFKSRKRSLTILSLILVLVLLVSVAPMASAAPAEGGSCLWTHLVRPGDTLGAIAFYYGTTVSDLLTLNPRLSSADLIYWGTTICVSTTQTPPPPFGSTYTVVSGDTLGYIAYRFGALLGDLVRTNNLGNPDIIFSGENLSVPTP